MSFKSWWNQLDEGPIGGFVSGIFKSNKGSGVTEEDLYQGPRAWSGYTPEAARVDPGAQAAQTNALDMVSRRARMGGRTAADEAMQASALRQSQQATAAQRGAAVQRASAQGLGAQGGLLASLAGSQADSNAAADFAAQSAMNAQQRGDAATSEMASLGRDLQGQAAMRGAATDAFNQWAQGQQTGAFKDVKEYDQAARDEQMAAFNSIINGISSIYGGGGGG